MVVQGDEQQSATLLDVRHKERDLTLQKLSHFLTKVDIVVPHEGDSILTRVLLDKDRILGQADF